MHGQNQSNSHSKKDAQKYVLLEESTIKARPTHILKEDRLQSVSPEKCIKNQASSLSETTQATVNVARRAYIENQANSPSTMGHSQCHQKCAHEKTRSTHNLKQDRPQSVSPEECTLKTRPNSLSETRQATVCVTKRVHIKNHNSLSETRQARICVTRRVHIKNQANSLAETRQATVCITERVHINYQTSSPSEKRQATVCVTRRVLFFKKTGQLTP